MPTKNIVPRTGSEGKIGTISKRWGEGNFDTIDISGSSRFGSELTDTHVFTGSFLQTGSGASSTFIDEVHIMGNVGIGTTSPASLVDYGALQIDGTDGGRLRLSKDGAAKASIFNGGQNEDNLFIKAENSTGSIFFLPGATGSATLGLLDSGDSYFKGGNVGVGTSLPDHKLAVIGDISASVNVSASAFYGDGQYLDNVGGNLQDVTDLGNTTTNSITTSGYHFGTSDGKIYDDDGEFRIRVLTTPGSPFEIRSGADVTYDNEIVCIMERPSDDERTNVLFGSGLNTLQAQRQLEVISRERLDSSYGVMFGTDEAAKFMNLEIRTAHDDSYSALDLTTNTAASSLQTSDYFGEADISGFRLRYMEDDLQFKIQSGNGATVDDRLVIDRDTGEVSASAFVASSLSSISGENLTIMADNSLYLDTNANAYVRLDRDGTGDNSFRVQDTSNFTKFAVFETGQVEIGGNLSASAQIYASGQDNGTQVVDFDIDWDEGMTQEVILSYAPAVLPDGYTGEPYEYTWDFNIPGVLSVAVSGMPPWMTATPDYAEQDITFSGNPTYPADVATTSIDVEQNDGSGTTTYNFDVTITAPPVTTLTASFDNVKPYTTYQLIHKIGKDNMAIYFEDEIYWPGATRPTLSTTSGSIDILTFTTDGNSPNPNIYGVAQYNFSASVG